VYKMLKKPFVLVIIFVRKEPHYFYDVSYTIYPRFLCSGTLRNMTCLYSKDVASGNLKPPNVWGFPLSNWPLLQYSMKRSNVLYSTPRTLLCTMRNNLISYAGYIFMRKVDLAKLIIENTLHIVHEGLFLFGSDCLKLDPDPVLYINFVPNLSKKAFYIHKKKTYS
jgi:hypothetical protein